MSRDRILAALTEHSQEMTVAELATQLRVHPNTVRFHLEALLRSHRVESVSSPPRGPGRPARRVRAVAGMNPDGPRHYRGLAEALTRALATAPDGPEQARQVGLAWGARVAVASPTNGSPMTRLVEMLTELGFAPESDTATHLDLGHCPFLELASAAPDIICSLHLGLMQGALDVLSGHQHVTRLEPFVAPDRCRAHLEHRRAS